MRLLIQFAALCAMSSAAFAVDARKSADGVAFPAVDVKPFPLTLPGIADSIGRAPETATKEKIYSIAGDNTVVKGWQRLLTNNKIEPGGFTWISRNAHGSGVQMYALENGKVSYVEMVIPSLTREQAKNLLDPLRRLDKQATFNTDFKITVNGVRIRGKFDGWHKIGDDSGFYSGIILWVDPVDWYLAFNDIQGDIATAMKNGTPAIGMTRAQASLVFGEQADSTQSATQETITWYWKEPIPEPYDPNGTTRQDEYFKALGGLLAGTKQQIPMRTTRIVTMTFVNGVCVRKSERSPN